jgi:hypothetical protein
MNIEVVSSSFLVRLQYSGGFVKVQSKSKLATTYCPLHWGST